MARIFRLGDFFGLTATQLALFQPEGFDTLLSYRYTEQVRESLYSLYKEFCFLKKRLETENMQPDYERLIDDFKFSGFLGFNTESKNNRVKMGIAKFFKASKEKSVEDLREEYGPETDEILDIVNENLTIDIMREFPDISTAGVKVVNALYRSRDYINAMCLKCLKRYEETSVTDAVVSGKSMADIMELDKDSNENDKSKSCYFVNQMYRRLDSSRSHYERMSAIDAILHDISRIESEYNVKDIVFTDVETISDTLSNIYSELTVERFMDITGITDEDLKNVKQNGRGTMQDLLLQLDSFLIGGIGFNNKYFGDAVCDTIKYEDTQTKSVKGRERNNKLDSILRIAYMDLQSKKYMASV